MPLHLLAVIFQEVGSFPFPWVDSLTSDASTCELLESKGCHRKGIWGRECKCGGGSNWGSLAPDFPQDPRQVHSATDLASRLGLPRAEVPCSSAAVSSTSFRCTALLECASLSCSEHPADKLPCSFPCSQCKEMCAAHYVHRRKQSAIPIAGQYEGVACQLGGLLRPSWTAI